MADATMSKVHSKSRVQEEGLNSAMILIMLGILPFRYRAKTPIILHIVYIATKSKRQIYLNSYISLGNLLGRTRYMFDCLVLPLN